MENQTVTSSGLPPHPEMETRTKRETRDPGAATPHPCPPTAPLPARGRRHLPIASRSRRLPCSGGMAYLQEKGGMSDTTSCGHHASEGPSGCGHGLRAELNHSRAGRYENGEGQRGGCRGRDPHRRPRSRGLTGCDGLPGRRAGHAPRSAALNLREAQKAKPKNVSTGLGRGRGQRGAGEETGVAPQPSSGSLLASHSPSPRSYPGRSLRNEKHFICHHSLSFIFTRLTFQRFLRLHHK